MKLKNLKKEYIAYALLALGFVFILMAMLWQWFYFFALPCFLAGGIVGMITAIENYKKEKAVLKQQVAEIIAEDLEMQRLNYEEEDVEARKLGDIVDARTMLDYRSYKFGLIWRIVLFSFVAILSVAFFVGLCMII